MSDFEKKVVDGFNAGYIIEKYQPDLAQLLLESVASADTPYVEGFIAGSKESILERERTRSKTISKLKSFGKSGIPRPTKGKDRDGKAEGFEIDI
ncbi:hypothetical protein [Flavilitoribacter nigricans]|uniref:Uncharacterized protein n=1 Tax=Flavilitoribacter nigricans (strain ATCC 23147 / DSM 23189 / NBRC 102662 / NCIMB 1420 / SS-2) TaxID=1122177 RepID=A0A2D0MXD8_FLAN2|nr:hypothetical protein [Flavilitoribacter nigricans]PHN00924.1 hypothetical protein CRP01_39710 [Flavilitoribacter nigricans DSM 23189 = NBRC 102662]